MPRIFSTHQLHPAVTLRLAAAGDYRVASAPTAAAIMAEGLGAEVLIVRTNIPPEYFAQAPNLRAAVRHGAGLDMVPMQAPMPQAFWSPTCRGPMPRPSPNTRSSPP